MVISVGPAGRGGFGQRTQILHACAKRHHWKGVGPLSVKCFFKGEATYRVGRACYALREREYLILNRGQSYEISVDSKAPAESLCVFFAAGFVEDVHRSLTLRSSQLLNDPRTPVLSELNFFERIYPRDDLLSPLLLQLRNELSPRQPKPGWLEGRIHRIAMAMLRVHRRECQRTELLGALRPATREELYRRLNRARDYARSLFDQPLTLDDLAGVACMSTNHFLRTFRQAFGRTPHRFLNEYRLEAARRMLSSSACSVTDVCLATGFQSLGSFSWSFRRRFGLPPTAWQKKVISEKRRTAGAGILPWK